MSDSENEEYPEWYHPDHRVKDRTPQPISELQGPTRWTVNQSVVKLEFDKDNKRAVGSGFILLLPPEAIPNDVVILTAAHNLAALPTAPATTVTRTKNMQITFITGEVVDVNDSQTYLSKDYSTQSGPDADYGFIRIPKPSKPANPPTNPGTKPSPTEWGFGFSLQFSYFPPAYVRQLHITGYTPKGVLTDMIGPPLGFRDNEVEYDMDTEQGISGSAVWLVYERAPIVVAIHNNGRPENQPKKGSRGAPISPKIIQTLYEWLQSHQSLIVQNKKMQAVGTSKKPHPPLGLFLSFSIPRGRVRMVTGSSFDKVLVQTTPGEPKYGFVYALRLSNTSKWVQYNTKTGQVVLTEKLGRDCFSFWDEKKGGAVVQIGVSAKSAKDWLILQLRADYVAKGRETLEVFLTTDGDKKMFYLFNLV